MNKQIAEVLKSREFLSVATADMSGQPNAAPKFLLKIEDNTLYLVDYIIGKTFKNLSNNPRVSISFMDNNSLVGYQLNGRAEIIEKGPEYDLLIKELAQREIDLSTLRIVEGVTKGQSHKGFLLSMPAGFVMFKVKVEEVAEMTSSGVLTREKI